MVMVVVALMMEEKVHGNHGNGPGGSECNGVWWKLMG